MDDDLVKAGYKSLAVVNVIWCKAIKRGFVSLSYVVRKTTLGG